MNTIDFITARIEEYRATNKNPCKNYATKEAAEKATAIMAQRTGNYFDKHDGKDAKPARYVVFFNEAWGRWVGAIDLTELMRRDNFAGGYIGFCSANGFFSY